jgi:hypothetical protein
MQSEGYRESLKDAIQNLAKVNESIFQIMVPVLMTGEMKEWSAEVPIGEVHNFEWELFFWPYRASLLRQKVFDVI